MLRIESVFSVVLLAAGACTHPPQTPMQTDNRAIVPSLPPTTGLPPTVATESYATANLITRDDVFTGPFPRDLLWVWFRDEASQLERQEAINAIRGQVVGGFRYRPGGVYYVRIKDDGTAGTLHRAISRLKSFSQVVDATPDLSLAVSPI